MIDLGEGIEGYIRTNEISREKIEDARERLKEGETIEAKVMNIDRKSQTISLSIKAKDSQEEAETLQNYSKQSEPVTTIGDLLKEQMNK